VIILSGVGTVIYRSVMRELVEIFLQGTVEFIVINVVGQGMCLFDGVVNGRLGSLSRISATSAALEASPPKTVWRLKHYGSTG